MKSLLIGDRVYNVTEKQFKEYQELKEYSLTCQGVFEYDVQKFCDSIENKSKKSLKIDGSFNISLT